LNIPEWSLRKESSQYKSSSQTTAKIPLAMTTTPQPAAPRRRFRFGLRTLLVAVTRTAVGS
jgi:hypothetical protein